MLFKKRPTGKYLITFIIIAFISISAIVYFAMRNITWRDPQLLVVSQKISKALIMRVFDKAEVNFSSTSYAPTPFDSPDFSYADLTHPYFEEIRNDKRVAHFDSNLTGAVDFSDAIDMKEYKNGIAINFYNRWIDKNLSRRHPARPPSIMAYYVGNSAIERFYYKHDSKVITDEIYSKLYMKPSE